MNKQKGYVSAVKDNLHKTVIDILEKPYSMFDMKICGRLDKDTTGLLILSNDGEFIHKITSPKKEVYKGYFVTTEKVISNLEELEKGVEILVDKEKYFTLPAKTKYIDEHHFIIYIKEGKFHQVKLMVNAINNNVVELERLSIGSLTLPESLKYGEYIELTEEEISKVFHNLESL